MVDGVAPSSYLSWQRNLRSSYDRGLNLFVIAEQPTLKQRQGSDSQIKLHVIAEQQTLVQWQEAQITCQSRTTIVFLLSWITTIT